MGCAWGLGAQGAADEKLKGRDPDVLRGDDDGDSAGGGDTAVTMEDGPVGVACDDPPCAEALHAE